MKRIGDTSRRVTGGPHKSELQEGEGIFHLSGKDMKVTHEPGTPERFRSIDSSGSNISEVIQKIFQTEEPELPPKGRPISGEKVSYDEEGTAYYDLESDDESSEEETSLGEVSYDEEGIAYYDLEADEESEEILISPSTQPLDQPQQVQEGWLSWGSRLAVNATYGAASLTYSGVKAAANVAYVFPQAILHGATEFATEIPSAMYAITLSPDAVDAVMHPKETIKFTAVTIANRVAEVVINPNEAIRDIVEDASHATIYTLSAGGLSKKDEVVKIVSNIVAGSTVALAETTGAVIPEVIEVAKEILPEKVQAAIEVIGTSVGNIAGAVVDVSSKAIEEYGVQWLKTKLEAKKMKLKKPLEDRLIEIAQKFAKYVELLFNYIRATMTESEFGKITPKQQFLKDFIQGKLDKLAKEKNLEGADTKRYTDALFLALSTVFDPTVKEDSQARRSAQNLLGAFIAFSLKIDIETYGPVIANQLRQEFFGREVTVETGTFVTILLKAKLFDEKLPLSFMQQFQKES